MNSVCFSPDGTKIASGSDDKTVLIWDAASGEQLCSLTGHSDSVWSVALSKDGTRLVSGSADRTVKIWSAGSAGTFECESTLTVDAGIDGVLSVCFSPTDNVIAAGCSNGNIYLVDAQAGEVKSSLRGHRYVPFLCIECLLL